MATEYLWIALVAIAWGGYPLLMRASGYSGPWAPLVLALVSLLPIALAALWQSSGERPSRPALAQLFVAGLLQGVGLFAFLRVATGKLEASVAIPISDTAMLLVTALGAVVFFREALTVQKLCGLALLVLGIALLRPSQ